MDPLLFVIYTNNLDNNVVNNSKFAYDTKICCAVGTKDKCVSLQCDLGKKLHMLFNSGKCKMLNIDKLN